jgi:hypothetical protein
MTELDLGAATTTDLKNQVSDYTVQSQTPDENSGNQDETWYDFPDSNEYLGYYKTIPELKKAIDALATWTTGKGFESDLRTKNLLEVWRGSGKDNISSILWNLHVMKKVMGDSFAEIIRADDGTIVNLKPLSTGNMRVVYSNQGLLVRYEQRSNIEGNPNKKFDTEDIFHLTNDRVLNEIHGTSIIEAVKWVIDARNEAMTDERKIKHRELSLGILYVDTSNTAKINAIKTQYANAIKNGELLVLPKDTAEIKDSGVKPQDRIQWIQYLENFFYQAVGVPRVIATSENFTEASSKVGYLTFEPIYTREQADIENSIFSQLQITLKFNRPPSLGGSVERTEEKNTGQTGFQPQDTQLTAEGTE